MIKVENLRAGYGDGPDVLQGVSLNANQSEILIILGPNGCGKSTLIKTIAGYLRPREGTIALDGMDLSSVPIEQKVTDHGFAYVPQVDNVFPALTVLENIKLGARRLATGEAKERTEELFDHYPALAKKQNQAASALSGGERQILSLSRALVTKPKVLLLDEPSAGLSPKAMHELFDEILAIKQRRGICIIMVEQNAAEALRIGDRGLILQLGKVAMEGPVSNLLGNPQVRELYLGVSAGHADVELA